MSLFFGLKCRAGSGSGKTYQVIGGQVSFARILGIFLHMTARVRSIGPQTQCLS